MQVLAYNKKAKFNYILEEEFEAGIALLGSEVKSARSGKVNISEAYVADIDDELFLLNSNIAEYKGANRFNHAPKRARKLLLHKKEINKLLGKVKLRGYSLVAVKIYLNDRNIIKLTVALGKGKKLHDKRETIKKRDEARAKNRGED